MLKVKVTIHESRYNQVNTIEIKPLGVVLSNLAQMLPVMRG